MRSKCVLEEKYFFLSVCITVVGIVIRLHLGYCGILSPGRDRTVCALQTSRVALGPPSLLFNRYQKMFCLKGGLKQAL